MEDLMLLLALVILLALLWRPFKKNVLGALDSRSERIRAELDEAQRLHEEAKEMLAKYTRQLEEGEKLAGEIRDQGAADRKRLEERLRADFDVAMKRRTDLAVERIAQEEAKATAEVRARAADLAIRTTRRLLTDKVGEGEAHTLLQNAIGEVDRKLA